MAGSKRPGAPLPPREYARAAEEQLEYSAMTPQALQKHIHKLEEKMYRHARDLEFEEAAAIRDQLERIRNASLRGIVNS